MIEYNLEIVQFNYPEKWCFCNDVYKMINILSTEIAFPGLNVLFNI